VVSLFCRFLQHGEAMVLSGGKMTRKINAAVAGLIQAWVLGLLAFTAVVACADDSAAPAVQPVASKVERASARLVEDRAGALATLRALWEDSSEPESSAAAVALVNAMAKDAEPGELADLCEAMLSSGRLQPGDAPQVFWRWLPSLKASKRWPDDETSLRARAQAISDAAPAGKASAQPWGAIGVAEIGFGRFAQAESAIRTALALQADQPPTEFLKSTHSNLGVALAQQGKMDEALAAFLASDATREALGLPQEADLLGNLASLYIYLKRWDQAIEYSNRAIAVIEPNTARLASQFNTLGNALFGLGDLDGARVKFEEDLAISERIGAPTSRALNNLAFVLLKQGNAREALRRFEQVERIAAEGDDSTPKGIAEKNIGETWIALGDRDRADKYLQKARAIYAADDNRPKRLELFPVLIDNLAALGRHADALEAMREFKTLSDEMVNVTSNERIADMENTAELKRKEAELAISQADVLRLQAQEAAERLQRRAMMFGLLGLVLVFGLLLLNLRNKAKANLALTRKNAEIESQHAQLRDINDVVRRQSEEDALTGLHNRRYLQARLTREFRQAVGAPPPPMLVVVIDLDHFKRINDQYGHLIGDRVLQHVAGVLRGCQRSGDDLIRWGGEEFVWLCPNTSAEQGPGFCQRLHRALESTPVEIDGAELQIEASMGFAGVPLWPDRSADPDLALRLADHAVYEAKHAGRNTWRGYVGRKSPPVEAGLARQPVEAMLEAGWLALVD
jgi:diguanylate cyclase (GGDEF)-like protein